MMRELDEAKDIPVVLGSATPDINTFYKANENKIEFDETHKKDGRGAYICDSIECLEKVIKSKRLEKVLESQISEEVYNNLRGVIIDK